MVIRTIGAKGQITIPIEIRRKLGLYPGHKLNFRETEHGVVVESAESAVYRLAGMLSEYTRDRPTVTIEEMKEAAAAVWARESINANYENHR